MIQQLTARLARSHDVDRPRRSDPRHRQRCADRDRALRIPVAALCAGGQAAIKTLPDLKGKTISIGGAKDITRIYVERMLAPSGIKPGEFDMVFAGATSARAAALASGAVDAAILLPPFNFQAVAHGFNELGRTIDFAPELPFSGTVVDVAWAKGHARPARGCLMPMPRRWRGSRTSAIAPRRSR